MDGDQDKNKDKNNDEGKRVDMFASLLALRSNSETAEKLSPAAHLRLGLEICAQADRIHTLSGKLQQDGGRRDRDPAIDAETPAIADALSQIENDLRRTSIELAAIVDKEFSETDKSVVFDMTSCIEACFWRNRIIGHLFLASCCYKLAAELLSLAGKTLGNVSSALEGREKNLLLNHAGTLLSDAVGQISTAGITMGEHEADLRSLEATGCGFDCP